MLNFLVVSEACLDRQRLQPAEPCCSWFMQGSGACRLSHNVARKRITPRVSIQSTANDLSVGADQLDSTVNALHHMVQADAIAHFSSSLYQTLSGDSNMTMKIF
jgi:hypothetical protein